MRYARSARGGAVQNAGNGAQKIRLKWGFVRL
jgi:hypothetical protein